MPGLLIIRFSQGLGGAELLPMLVLVQLHLMIGATIYRIHARSTCFGLICTYIASVELRVACWAHHFQKKTILAHSQLSCLLRPLQ